MDEGIDYYLGMSLERVADLTAGGSLTQGERKEMTLVVSGLTNKQLRLGFTLPVR